jgi:hypothetical protein
MPVTVLPRRADAVTVIAAVASTMIPDGTGNRIGTTVGVLGRAGIS